jgi:hypothetical protein
MEYASYEWITPPEMVARIEALALLRPVYGCNRLEALLGAGNRRLSAITTQRILNDKGLGMHHERWWRWSVPTPTRQSS